MGALTGFFFLLLLTAAAQKALHRGSGGALARLGAGAEGGLALALAVPATRSLGLLLAMGLWLAYAAYLFRLYRQTPEAACPCGDWQPLRVGPFVIGRALVLAGLAAVAAASACASPSPPPLAGLSGALLGLAYLALLAGVSHLQLRRALAEEGRFG